MLNNKYVQSRVVNNIKAPASHKRSGLLLILIHTLFKRLQIPCAASSYTTILLVVQRRRMGRGEAQKCLGLQSIQLAHSVCSDTKLPQAVYTRSAVASGSFSGLHPGDLFINTGPVTSQRPGRSRVGAQRNVRSIQPAFPPCNVPTVMPAGRVDLLRLYQMIVPLF